MVIIILLIPNVLRILLSSGIEVIAMSQESWTKLVGFADIKLPKYQDSARQKLDKRSDNFRKLREYRLQLTAVQVCKRSEYFLERSMSGTEVNYRNMYPMGLCIKRFKVKKGNFDISVHQ